MLTNRVLIDLVISANEGDVHSKDSPFVDSSDDKFASIEYFFLLFLNKCVIVIYIIDR